mmetsp:Transcript_22497/g.48778  ORF Transcript_22497/g.48778 Transcript_22497/m.48778 type:complete len:218 (+) Transcript_22497:403-1056(+)
MSITHQNAALNYNVDSRPILQIDILHNRIYDAKSVFHGEGRGRVLAAGTAAADQLHRFPLSVHHTGASEAIRRQQEQCISRSLVAESNDLIDVSQGEKRDDASYPRHGPLLICPSQGTSGVIPIAAEKGIGRHRCENAHPNIRDVLHVHPLKSGMQQPRAIKPPDAIVRREFHDGGIPHAIVGAQAPLSPYAGGNVNGMGEGSEQRPHWRIIVVLRT